IVCPICGSARHRPYLTTSDPLHGIGSVFQIVRCRDCRHIYMNPCPTTETLSLCYPVEYGPHAGRTVQDHETESADQTSTSDVSTGSTRPWYLSAVCRRIPGLRACYYWLSNTRSNYLPGADSGDARAVELGCATGGFLDQLAAAGWQAEGVELVESAAAQAQQDGLTVHVGTLHSAEYASDTFDGAFAWMVFEHLPDPRETLEECHRILKQDGLLAFSVPNVSCWEPVVFGRNWYVWEVPRHLQYFGPRCLKKLLTESGFDGIEIIHQRNLLNVVGSVAIFLRKIWPNSRLARRLLDFPSRPGMWWQLMLAPAALFLATIRQSGRLTVLARCSKQRDTSAGRE
ncbi:MAG: class I SAM-dependent methyltransferase, partial [Planctomycetaceae bacterium]